jgi:hypothetical protein
MKGGLLSSFRLEVLNLPDVGKCVRKLIDHVCCSTYTKLTKLKVGGVLSNIDAPCNCFLSVDINTPKMEDLAGLNFSSSASSQPKSAPPNQTQFPQNSTTTSANYISPIPSRGISPNYTISPSQSNGTTSSNTSIPRSSSTSKPDSFASLSAFSGIISRQGQNNANTTLEQQRLAKERERKETLDKEKKKLDMHFGANDFWEKHSRTNTPTITTTDT